MKYRVAFVTYQKHPEITPDDALAKTALAGFDIDTVGIPWDQPNVHWPDFDAVIVRSCWDYVDCPALFRSWIEDLQRRHVLLLNQPSILLWNTDKTYLKDLRDSGVAIIPTVYAARDNKIAIIEVLARQHWVRAVIKPTISGTSFHTWVTSSTTIEDDQRRLDILLTERSMMLQEYLPEIETDGELSLIYFDGQYSHSVRKVPRTGDFRVQSDFGGQSNAVQPDPAIRIQADQILRAAARDFVYARVDGVIRNRRFLLMELEMVEPHLFLETDIAAPQRFACAIAKRLRP